MSNLLNALKTAITIDFEAERRSDGTLFPTEVGLSWVGGRTTSCFIKPIPTWNFRGQRSDDYEEVLAVSVARSIAKHAQNKLLISDACFVDQPLLDLLMKEAGLPKIKLEGFFPLLDRLVVETGIPMSQVNRWINEIDEKRGEAHRAGDDAKVRAVLLARILKQVKA